MKWVLNYKDQKKKYMIFQRSSFPSLSWDLIFLLYVLKCSKQFKAFLTYSVLFFSVPKETKHQISTSFDYPQSQIQGYDCREMGETSSLNIHHGIGSRFSVLHTFTHLFKSSQKLY